MNELLVEGVQRLAGEQGGPTSPVASVACVRNAGSEFEEIRTDRVAEKAETPDGGQHLPPGPGKAAGPGWPESRPGQ